MQSHNKKQACVSAAAVVASAPVLHNNPQQSTSSANEYTKYREFLCSCTHAIRSSYVLLIQLNMMMHVRAILFKDIISQSKATLVSK